MNLGFLPTKDEAIESLKITARRTRDIAVSGLADNIWKNQKLVDGAAVIKETLAKGMEISHGLRVGATEGLYEGTILPVAKLAASGIEPGPRTRLFGQDLEDRMGSFIPDNEWEVIGQAITNPGKYLPKELERMGLPAPMASLFGLAADIAAPGVGGELGTLDDAAKLAAKVADGKVIAGLGEDFDKIADFLRSVKNLGFDDIVAKRPDIQLTKEVPAKDIHGEKVVIPEGEALTPYELKGNKVMLVDGETYVVSKNQAQNIQGQAVVGEAKPFAPELKGTTETIRSGADTKFSAQVLPGGENYEEILVQAPGRDVNEVSQELYDGRRYDDLNDQEKNVVQQGAHQGGFQGAHYTDWDILTHLRMNDRAFGKSKVAFVEEVQSDWMSAFRRQTKDDKIKGHPLLAQWTRVAAQRALKEAVGKGAKYLSWTTGEQQAARYSLTKELNGVNWEQAGDTKAVWLERKDGNTTGFDMTDDGTIVVAGGGLPESWVGKKVEDAVGAEVAARIKGSDTGGLEGEGLNIGGEWAKNLYDRQFKNIIEDLTGAKVKNIDMGLPVGRSSDEVYNYEDELGNFHELTEDKLEVGMTVHASDMFGGQAVTNAELTVTKKLGGGKFEAAGDFGDVDTYELPVTKMSKGQPSIELTPAIIAKIKGEAPVIKKKPRAPKKK